MKKILFALFIAGMVIGCSSHTTHDAKLKTDTDSVAYIIGLNIGTNLLRMDSTLNIEAVCRGIREVAQGHPSMSLEEAETYFLGYMNYTLPEKAMALEEQWLADLAESSRDYARTRTGITYHIQVLGDQERLPVGSRDSLFFGLRVLSTDNQERYSTYAQGDTLKLRLDDLKPGLQESVKLIGEGGKMIAWIPSKLAFGVDGNEEMNISGSTTLGFEIELFKLDKYAEWSRR
ncbi:MAG: FKBP-type peptidyl-prolyl cis-trans isomerase [Alistipes sp.]|nr:FKBP-type peptidyl-prolyl cis-trans isomerase [Alistipes sp.]